MASTRYRNAAFHGLRPALASDARAIAALTHDAFGPGEDRTPADTERRLAHLLADCDPTSMVAETAAGTLVGAAITIRRGPVVLLALAVVAPDLQGRGLGRALLEDFPAPAAGVQRAILSSTDPKAMRRYAALGLALHPSVSAGGVLRPGAVAPAPGTVAATPRQAAAVLDAIALEVRGVPYGPDVALLEAQGDQAHLAGEEAVVVRHGGVIRLAVARTPDAGALALRAALAAVPPGVTVHLNQLRAGMDWAVREALAAGLALSPEGPVFSDQPLSPLHLPTGTLF